MTNQTIGIRNGRLIRVILAAAFVLSTGIRSYAQWSHREGDPEPPTKSNVLFQRFTKAEWDASNFAPEEDLKWFREARVGFLGQFGLATRNNADPAWGLCYTRKAPDNISRHGPIADDVWPTYAKELKFEKFNAKEWVDVMQRAGFKYFITVAKHHEGFHWWDSKYSDFKITNTPFGRDMTKELADACHAKKMRFGIYYAQREWHHPDYFPVDYHNALQKGIKPSEMSGPAARHVKYLEYNKNVVRELLTNYGQVDVFWWDAAWWGGMFTADMWDGENLTRMVREVQPHILQNNRVSLPGDYDTPEQRVGHYQDWRPWETCASIAKEWGNPMSPLKPLSQLVGMIVKATCNDGNIVLGCGPQWDGSFTEAQKQRLFEIGDWLKENGTAIYGTRGGPWKSAMWGGSTRRGKSVFLHIIDCPGATLQIPALPQRRVASARLLGGKPLEFKQTAQALEITVPMEMRKPMDTIVELTMDQSVDGMKAIESGATGHFDELSYGRVVAVPNDATVAVSSRTEESGDPKTLFSPNPPAEFVFQTNVEVKPWVQIDLGRELSVTAVRLFKPAKEAKIAPFRLHISSDGETWTPAGDAYSDTGVTEITLTRFDNGAWVPGKNARYLRVQCPSGSAAALRLRQIEIWAQ